MNSTSMLVVRPESSVVACIKDLPDWLEDRLAVALPPETVTVVVLVPLEKVPFSVVSRTFSPSTGLPPCSHFILIGRGSFKLTSVPAAGDSNVKLSLDTVNGRSACNVPSKIGRASCRERG